MGWGPTEARRLSRAARLSALAFAAGTTAACGSGSHNDSTDDPDLIPAKTYAVPKGGKALELPPAVATWYTLTVNEDAVDELAVQAKRAWLYRGTLHVPAHRRSAAATIALAVPEPAEGHVRWQAVFVAYRQNATTLTLNTPSLTVNSGDDFSIGFTELHGGTLDALLNHQESATEEIGKALAPTLSPKLVEMLAAADRGCATHDPSTTAEEQAATPKQCEAADEAATHALETETAPCQIPDETDPCAAPYYLPGASVLPFVPTLSAPDDDVSVQEKANERSVYMGGYRACGERLWSYVEIDQVDQPVQSVSTVVAHQVGQDGDVTILHRASYDSRRPVFWMSLWSGQGEFDRWWKRRHCGKEPPPGVVPADAGVVVRVGSDPTIGGSDILAGSGAELVITMTSQHLGVIAPGTVVQATIGHMF